MYKKILVMVLALVMCLGSAADINAEEGNGPGIQIDGRTLGASAVILEGEVFLPLRAVAEELGFDLEWHGNNVGISLYSPDKNIEIDLSKYKYAVNGHEIFLRGEYRLIEGVTFMRKDFFSGVLGLKTVWDKASNRVILQAVDEKNDIIVNTKKENSETRNLKLSLQYPELSGMENAEAESKLNSMFAALAKEAGERGLQAAEEMAEEQLARGIKAEVYYDYRVEYNRKGIISIVLSDYIYGGGAHGLTVQSSYTFDLETGTEYELKDLFKAGTDYVSIISGEVKKQMEERKLTGYVVAFEAIRPDQDFFLSSSGLVVYFQAYEYTPYAAGIPEFELDFPSTGKYLGPSFEFLDTIPLQFKREASEQKVKAENKMQIGAMLQNVDAAGGRAYIYEKIEALQTTRRELYGGAT